MTISSLFKVQNLAQELYQGADFVADRRQTERQDHVDRRLYLRPALRVRVAGFVVAAGVFALLSGLCALM